MDDVDGPFVEQQETNMNTQEVEISATELTTEDLETVHGGVRNNETAIWQSFAFGMAKGWIEAGGSVNIQLHF
jgi:hypothetical protein